MYDKNGHGEIVNGDGTFEQAAMDLQERGMVILNWTDRLGSMFNVLLALDPTRVGAPGGQVDQGPNKLWVGVAGKGCHGFSATGGYLTTDYLGEKLGWRGEKPTVQALAEMLTGVREALAEAFRVERKNSAVDR